MFPFHMPSDIPPEFQYLHTVRLRYVRDVQILSPPPPGVSVKMLNIIKGSDMEPLDLELIMGSDMEPLELELLKGSDMESLDLELIMGSDMDVECQDQVMN
ncbi:hypothetical protein AMELA_G00058900 [Ameiurus melas]|uniref:Uncharacterized protein n=1 Tax=Ameiurus melas TaxID=219545 RepID=A0A7J6B0Y7_AMEME|nr:hypothetical protein AMELA_G00058900 [Ameiurus melas]